MTTKKTSPAPAATTNDPANIAKFVSKGRDKFRDLIALEAKPGTEERSLSRWEIGLQSRIIANEGLQKLLRTPDGALSLMNAVVEACQMGFRSSPTDEHFSLVPFGNECQMIPSKRGYQHIARDVETFDHGVLYRCDAERLRKDGLPVFDPDSGELNFDPHPIMDAEGESRTDADIVGAWVTCKVRGRDKLLGFYMRRSEIEKHRQASKVPNGPGWSNWYDRMAMKTVAKAFFRSGLVKLGHDIPVDAETPETETVVPAEWSEKPDAPADTAALERAALQTDPFPGERDDLLADLSAAVDEHGVDGDALDVFATRRYGRAADDLPPALIASLIRDVEDGKVRD